MSAKPHNYFISVCLRCQHEPQLNTRICPICANLSHCQHVRAGTTASISQFGLSVIRFRRSRLPLYSPSYSWPAICLCSTELYVLRCSAPRCHVVGDFAHAFSSSPFGVEKNHTRSLLSRGEGFRVVCGQ